MGKLGKQLRMGVRVGCIVDRYLHHIAEIVLEWP